MVAGERWSCGEDVGDERGNVEAEVGFRQLICGLLVFTVIEDVVVVGGDVDADSVLEDVRLFRRRWFAAEMGELERESEVVVLLKEEEMHGGCRECGG